MKMQSDNCRCLKYKDPDPLWHGWRQTRLLAAAVLWPLSHHHHPLEKSQIKKDEKFLPISSFFAFPPKVITEYRNDDHQ